VIEWTFGRKLIPETPSVDLVDAAFDLPVEHRDEPAGADVRVSFTSNAGSPGPAGFARFKGLAVPLSVEMTQRIHPPEGSRAHGAVLVAGWFNVQQAERPARPYHVLDIRYDAAEATGQPPSRQLDKRTSPPLSHIAGPKLDPTGDIWRAGCLMVMRIAAAGIPHDEAPMRQAMWMPGARPSLSRGLCNDRGLVRYRCRV
jgi:hypothetical protein